MTPSFISSYTYAAYSKYCQWLARCWVLTLYSWLVKNNKSSRGVSCWHHGSASISMTVQWRNIQKSRLTFPCKKTKSPHNRGDFFIDCICSKPHSLSSPSETSHTTSTSSPIAVQTSWESHHNHDSTSCSSLLQASTAHTLLLLSL